MITINGRQAEWREEMTVRDLLAEHQFTSPRIIVKVNNELIRKKDWDSYRVQDGDDVRAIHMIAGG